MDWFWFLAGLVAGGMVVWAFLMAPKSAESQKGDPNPIMPEGVTTPVSSDCCTDGVHVVVEGTLKPSDSPNDCESAIAVYAKAYPENAPDPGYCPPAGLAPCQTWDPDPGQEQTYQILVKRNGLNKGKIFVWGEYLSHSRGVHDFDCTVGTPVDCGGIPICPSSTTTSTSTSTTTSTSTSTSTSTTSPPSSTTTTTAPPSSSTTTTPSS